MIKKDLANGRWPLVRYCWLLRPANSRQAYKSSSQWGETTGQHGWEFSHLLIAHLLRSLRSNEQLWAIRSGQMTDCERILSWANRSWQMSYCERFTQVAHDKLASEQIAGFFDWIAHLLFSSQKTSNLFKKIWLKSYFLVRFWYIFLMFFFKLAIRTFPLF